MLQKGENEQFWRGKLTKKSPAQTNFRGKTMFRNGENVRFWRGKLTKSGFLTLNSPSESLPNGTINPNKSIF